MELFGSALLVVSLRQVLLRCRLAADLSLIQRAAIHFMHYPVNPFKLIEIGNMKFLLFLIRMWGPVWQRPGNRTKAAPGNRAATSERTK